MEVVLIRLSRPNPEALVIVTVLSFLSLDWDTGIVFVLVSVPRRA